VTRTLFGVLNGIDVYLYHLKNRSGMEVVLTNYGATLVSCLTRDRRGEFADIVLGFRTLEEYVESRAYFGGTIGRYANRIANARFVVDDRVYELSKNDGPHHLHGGQCGFDKCMWKTEAADDASVTLALTSPDGDQGYPGRLDVRVTYTLTDADQIRIEYEAATDKTTPVNLSHHSYFNLRGEGNGDVLGHDMVIHARSYTPVMEGLVPTGDISPVEGTPLDFQRLSPIGLRIGDADPQLRCAGGYDHNYVLEGRMGDLRAVAALTEPASGRTLEVATTEPGLQLYTGNFLDGTLAAKWGAGKRYIRHGGLCLEPQHFPDSPNQPQFPSTLLRAGERFSSQTVLKFGTAGR
jgi:aldose 1-epimerase